MPGEKNERPKDLENKIKELKANILKRSLFVNKGITKLKERIGEIDKILVVITEGRILELNAHKNIEEVLRKFIFFRNKWIEEIFEQNIDHYVLTKAQKWHLVKAHIFFKGLLAKLDSQGKTEIPPEILKRYKELNPETEKKEEQKPKIIFRREARERALSLKEINEALETEKKECDHDWVMTYLDKFGQTILSKEEGINKTCLKCGKTIRLDSIQIGKGEKLR